MRVFKSDTSSTKLYCKLSLYQLSANLSQQASAFCFVFDAWHLVFVLPSVVTSEPEVRLHSSLSNWHINSVGQGAV